MNQITFKILSLVLCFLLFFSCKKKEKEKVIEELPTNTYTYNNELQSSKDISFVTYVITDFNMMCAYASQGKAGCYAAHPIITTNTVTVKRDTTDLNNESLSLSFNKTPSMDGRLRDGKVSMFYCYDSINNPTTEGKVRNYEYYGFVTSLFLEAFTVNDWKIELYDSSKPAHISNTLDGNLYDPSNTNLTWEISGKFKFTHTIDPTRNIVWEGKIKKTLKNTSDKNVFPSKYSSVNWNLAKLDYSGSSNGTRSQQLTNFSYEINAATPLYRDLTCSYNQSNSQLNDQFHPFVYGTSTFSISNYHPRSINHGPTLNCDNKVDIVFNNETYSVELE